MEPWAREGDFVLAERMSYLFSRPRIGHLVVVRHPQKHDMLLLKRIVQEYEGMYWIEGDNTPKSIDSRRFGLLKRGLVLGKVIHKTGPCGRSIMS